MTDNARAQNDSDGLHTPADIAGGKTARRQAGTVGNDPLSYICLPYDESDMAVRDRDSSLARQVGGCEVALGKLVSGLPVSATCDLSVNDVGGSLVVDLERAGHRWTLEGSVLALELTAVDGPGEPALPERVPNWIVRALEATIGVNEVSVQR